MILCLKLANSTPIVGYIEQIRASAFDHCTMATESTRSIIFTAFTGIEIRLTGIDPTAATGIGPVKTAIADMISPGSSDFPVRVRFDNVGKKHLKDLSQSGYLARYQATTFTNSIQIDRTIHQTTNVA